MSVCVGVQKTSNTAMVLLFLIDRHAYFNILSNSSENFILGCIFFMVCNIQKLSVRPSIPSQITKTSSTYLIHMICSVNLLNEFVPSNESINIDLQVVQKNSYSQGVLVFVCKFYC